MFEFDKKTALITGSSAGIGRAFAKELHRRGANVVLVARRRDLIESLATELNQIREGTARVLPADLTVPVELRKVEDYIEANEIDILVNNAGRGSFGYFENLNREEERSLVTLNIVATMSLAHAIIPQLKARRSGGIISISSVAGFQPLPYMATYAGTKAFNLSHSMGLRYELAEFGVRVLAVCPGPVDTEFAGVARIPGTWTGGQRDSAAEVAHESLDAFVNNKGIVVPCLRAKIMALPCRLLPMTLTTWITERALRKPLRATSRGS